MITFIYTLLGSVIASIAFLSYKHPKHGQKLSSVGIWSCVILFLLVVIFNAGYNYGVTQYFKLDKNDKNLNIASNIISQDIKTILVVLAITWVSLFILYILSMTTFKDINDNIDKAKNEKTK